MMNPNSQYYLSFNLGYPNKLESALGYSGEALMVHGACSSSGCLALTDTGVAEIYSVVREAIRGGQSSFQVQAFPFRMIPENMAKNRNSPNFDFWKNSSRVMTILKSQAVRRRSPTAEDAMFSTPSLKVAIHAIRSLHDAIRSLHVPRC